MKANQTELLQNIANRYTGCGFAKRLEYFFVPAFIYVRSEIKDLLLNIVIFVPLGIYLPLLFRKANYKRDFAIAFACSCFFELFQFLFAMGGVQLQDIISNTAGGAIGLLLYFLLIRKWTYKTVNLINLAVCVIFLPFAVFCTVNTGIHYQDYVPFFDGTALRSLL